MITITTEDVKRKVRGTDAKIKEVLDTIDVYHLVNIEHGKIAMAVVDFPMSDEDIERYKDIHERFSQFIEEGRLVVLKKGKDIIRVFQARLDGKKKLENYEKYRDIVVKENILRYIVKNNFDDFTKKSCKRSIMKKQAQKNKEKRKGSGHVNKGGKNT